MAQQQNKLLFCMTPGISLATWAANGSIARELLLYERYVQKGWTVDILTCDRQTSLPYIPSGLKPVIGSWPFKGRLHLLNYFNLFNLERAVRAMNSCNVVKTNQSPGAWFYAAAARLARKPILLRCGWLPGRSLSNAGYSATYLAVLHFFEKAGMKMADAIEVATETDRRFIVKKYHIPENKIKLFPNWIDTEFFSPDESIEKITRSVVSVGRLDSVKRLDLLINACSAAQVSLLTLIGEGPKLEMLQKQAKKNNLTVKFLGPQPQAALPKILQKHDVFALTSRTEGHPKALLEAMACAMPCIGTDVQGINEVIIDSKNGLLCPSTVEGIATAIIRLCDNRSKAVNLGQQARKHVAEHCDFTILFNREQTLLESLCHGI